MTPDSFHREMAAWLVGQGVVLLTLVAGLLRWLLGREEERLLSKVSEVVTRAVTSHEQDSKAHRALVDEWEVRRDRRLDVIIANVGDTIAAKLRAAMGDALATHNKDQHAHPEGSEHRLLPLHQLIDKLNARLDGIEGKLDHLVTEHQWIAGRCRDGGK